MINFYDIHSWVPPEFYRYHQFNVLTNMAAGVIMHHDILMTIWTGFPIINSTSRLKRSAPEERRGGVNLIRIISFDPLPIDQYSFSSDLWGADQRI